MLPNNQLMDKPVDIVEFLYPRNKVYTLKESYEKGGKALSDPSDPLTLYEWKAWTDGTHIWCKRVDLSEEHLLLTDTDITEIDLTFDQNMYPQVCYVSNGLSKFWWYDSFISSHSLTEYPLIRNPRISLDDKRRFNVDNSDIIFAYIKDNKLCYKLQRNRYEDEIIIKEYNVSHNKILWRIGMSKDNRFLFYVR